MEKYEAGNFDVIVVGAGHAGAEAALASARLGLQTALFTLSLDTIANMPCNPSIGGTAKGHLVREIDALGGEMGKAADATTIQSRMLNRGKGPAVHSLRAQIDRSAYHTHMKEVLENQENLQIIQGEIIEILVEDQQVYGVLTRMGAIWKSSAVILASGTYLNAKIYVGDVSYESGPDGNLPAKGLSASLEKLNIPLRRFKTGTPARVHYDSIDYTQLDVQPGDEPVVPFSFETEEELKNLVDCYIAYTNGETHQVILDNLHRSPLYGGKIEGVGPRYCPSIEDKVVRFSDKERHQLFVEPMGMHTKEMYLQGMSSSLPEDVQLAFYRTIKGFSQVKIMRSAYAIEYDCCDPTCLFPTLEYKQIKGLYGAGQFNGTSGYEEAAAQGLVAGINAACQIQGKESVIFERSGSYIGTLIDDLVTKGCNDPYRMMTSRSEYRLILRQDNADSRLTELGYSIGLISKERYIKFKEKQKQIAEELKRIEKAVIPNTPALNHMLEEKGTTTLTQSVHFVDLLRRPQLGYLDLLPFDDAAPLLPNAVQEQVEILIKYEGYIKRQLAQVEQIQRLETRRLPKDLDYSQIKTLSLEAREKLNAIKPLHIGQASRISGVSPADIHVLLVYMERYHQGEEKE